MDSDQTDEIAEALGRTFPDLGSLGGVTHLATGASSVVVESGSGLIFRIGKTAASPASYRREAQLLPAIEGSLDIAVPIPEWFAEQTSEFPFGVIGYPKLPGVPLKPEHLESLD